MNRSATLLSLALFAGCGGSPQIDLKSGPGQTFEHSAPGDSKPATFSLLGIEPGRTTLEEFRSRFQAGEPQETAAKGVQTAEAGPGADLSADGLKVTWLKVAALDGVVFDVLAQVESEPAPEEWLGIGQGPGAAEGAGVKSWKVGTVQVLYAPDAHRLTATDTAIGVESFKRGLRDTIAF